MQNMEIWRGSDHPVLGEGGLEIFCAVGGLRALKNKILASGHPVKGAQKRIISISKNFLETSRQIFAKFSAFWGSSL